MPNDWQNWVFFVCIPTGCAIAFAAYMWRATQSFRTDQTAHPSQGHYYGRAIIAFMALMVFVPMLLGSYVFLPTRFPFASSWANWLLFICISAGCAITLSVYLARTNRQICATHDVRASHKYYIGVIIALIVLSELLIGNYVIFRRFSPCSFWVYSLSFSLVPIVSGCASWSTYARTCSYTPTFLATFVPIVLYSVLFFFGELVHIALFYYSGGR
jgi:hypothetical protein